MKSNLFKPENNNYDCIIIGAGLSGLTAAETLYKAGVDVLVLEAMRKPGGRATKEGAEWIHGHINNIICQFVQQLGLPLLEADPDSPESSCLYIDDQKVSPKEYQTYLELFESVLEESEKFGINSAPSSDISYLTAIESSLKKIKPTTNISIAALRIWIKSRLAIWEAADIEKISLKAKKGYEDLPGKQYLVNYPAIIEHLKQLLDKRLLTQQRIIQVEQQHHSFKVTTDKGQTFNAKDIIVTVPLGVLKQQHIRFSPPLPQNKLRAIQQLGFGDMTKVTLEFKACTWEPNQQFITLIDSRTEKAYVFMNMMAINKTPTLIAFVGGNAAKKIEKNLDPYIKTILFQLRRHYRDINLKTAHCSDWSHNPSTLGTYTYVPVHSSNENGVILAQPVNMNDSCTLHFAGEACSPHHYASVHGAIETGIKSAKAILRKKNIINPAEALPLQAKL